MQKSSDRNKKAGLLFLLCILFAILTASFYKNFLRAAPRDFFQSFQKQSETLVVGKIIADQIHADLPSGAKLGFASVEDFKYESKYLLQSYSIINRKNIESITLQTTPINDLNWSNGVGKEIPALVVNFKPTLEKYLGHTLKIEKDARLITSFTHDGIYTTIYLNGTTPLPQEDSSAKGLTFEISGEKLDTRNIKFQPYLSQFGAQGPLFSFLYFNTGNELSRLHLINSALLSLSIIGITLLYRRIFSIQFASVFLISITFSPWLVAFGRNLYWVPFTWFVPAAAAAAYYLCTDKKKKLLYLVILYIAFFLKCLSGYEYISSVILFAAAPFLYRILIETDLSIRKQYAQEFLNILLLGVFAFFTALLFHAQLRGDTVWSGLTHIYENDVKRRTYGDSALFSPEVAASLKASPWEVLRIYTFNWNTEILLKIPGSAFFYLIVAALSVIFYRIHTGSTKWRQELALLIAFFVVPTSWFFLAKSHSFIHAHMNFVLWYFGFIPALLCVAFNGLKFLALHTSAWLKHARIQDV